MLKVTWDHLHLRSPDPEATAAWFEQMLGAEIVRSPGRTDLNFGGSKIFIAQMTGDIATPQATPAPGVDHFGLVVTDIDAVTATLKAKGVEITRGPVTLRPGLRIVFLREPYGLVIELLDRDPKYV